MSEAKKNDDWMGHYEELRQDCRHFEPHRPCTPHKLRGKVCLDCDEYDPVQSRVCVVKLAATGDVLRTTAFLAALRQKHPGAELHWLTLPAAAPLFAANPLVDRLHVTQGDELPAVLQLTPFDAVYCPDADRETAALASLMPLAKNGRRYGFVLEAGQVRPLGDAAARWFVLGVSDAQKRANRSTYQDLVAAAIELPVPISDRPVLVLRDEERERARAWWKTVLPTASPRFVLGLNTGAGSRWPQKQWTLRGQSELVARVHATGGVTMLLGGPEEVQRHEELADACPAESIVDAGTGNTLRDFAARLELCDLVVTGDTMALHMACAFGKPVVALFGPTSPWEIELYGRGRKHFAEELDCLVCYSRCSKTPDCQDLIGVDEVWQSVRDLLAD